jgi:hypothetical protein
LDYETGIEDDSRNGDGEIPMDWEAVGALGEIFGAIAVVATLGYLAVQTRQNTSATHANTRQAILDSDQQFLTYLMDHPSIDSLRYAEELSEDERTRLGVFFLTFARMRESNWRQHQAGALDVDTWNSYANSIGLVLGSVNGRKWWTYYSQIPGVFEPDFISFMHKRLAEAPVLLESQVSKPFD